ncbi:MAG: four helix bundle protein, partial [Muribaculaceae bacterium]|nr:four helix bundle protein [Muribaculaceae bacterium]
EKSPKKLRWSIVARLQNTSVDVIEYLYRANYERDEKQRAEYQKRAAVSLNLLDFFTETAKRKQAINTRQMAIIAKQISEVKRMLSGWVKSAKKG